VLQAASTSTLG